MTRSRSRRLWVAAHKWIGLTIGLLLALEGLTGSIIVFSRELDVATHPRFYHPTASTRPASADAAVAALLAAGPVRFIRPPDRLVPVWTGLFTRAGEPWMASVDPGTGRLRGVRDLARSPVHLIYELHADLLLDRWGGERVVGVLGIVLAVSTASGIYLWWPSRRLARALTRLRRRPATALLLDLHTLAGVWTAVVVMAVALTGTAVVFPTWPRAALALFAATRPAIVRSGAGSSHRIDADRVLRIARAAAPSQEVSYLWLPAATDPAWRVGLRWRRVNAAYLNAGELTIDAATGAILRDDAATSQTAVARFLDMQLWLHNGAVFGWPGRLLVCASGLVLTGSYVTGVLLWWRRRARRRAIGPGPPILGQSPSLTPPNHPIGAASE